MRNVKYKLDKFRNNELGRSMILSMLCKPVGMIISILYTPLLLNYLGEEAYGLWSTILSVVNWINYFDVGIGNGLRNELAKEVGAGHKESSNQAVSTAYIILSTISGTVLIIGCLFIAFLDSNTFFNTTLIVKPALSISFVFICINFVLALSKVQLFATHQAEKVGFMTVFTQVINLIGICILGTFTQGNIAAVAILIGVSGLIVNVVFTGWTWKDHREFIPRIASFKKEKMSAIGHLGIKFFVIQMAALILYTTDNMIITRLFGPAHVTPYHTVYTAFGIINGLFSALISPLWTKYTVAMGREDFDWINSMILRLDVLLIPIGIALGIGTIIFEPVSRIWLHKTLDYGQGLIPMMAIYYFFYIWGSIYASASNGMGKVNLQMFMAVFTAIINIPLSIFFGKHMGMGSTGVLLATVICMLMSNILITISVHRYINDKKEGITDTELSNMSDAAVK